MWAESGSQDLFFYNISNFLFLRGKKLLNCVLLSISAHKFMHENVIKL